MFAHDKNLLRCPHCGYHRFSRVTPPFNGDSEVQCAACANKVKLADLHPARAAASCYCPAER